MTDFKLVNDAQQPLLDEFNKNPLFKTAYPKEEMFADYLSFFPEGTNPILRERTEHDCNCCKHFVRGVGNVVMIKGLDVVTIWDCDVPYPYDVVFKKMSERVKSYPIVSLFSSKERERGSSWTYDNINPALKWNHFHWEIDQRHVSATPNWSIGNSGTNFSVLKRTLEEIPLSAFDTVIELTHQKPEPLHRGRDYLALVERVRSILIEYAKVPDEKKNIFLWGVIGSKVDIGVRNSAIGTLLIDLANNVLIDGAVRSYEEKVSGGTFRRKTKVMTESQAKKFRKTVADHCGEDALKRQQMSRDSLPVEHMLFSKSAEKSLSVLDDLVASAQKTKKGVGTPKNFVEMSVDDFISDVLPLTKEIELLVKPQHRGQVFTLVEPQVSASGLLAWDNDVSLTFSGDVADAIKERVKEAGGKTDTYGRISCAWEGKDDLDLSVVEPSGFNIFFGDKVSPTGATLDIDANFTTIMKNPVENIYFNRKSNMREGVYKVYVTNYKRRSGNTGAQVSVTIGDAAFVIHVGAIPQGVSKSVLTFSHSKKDGVKILESLEIKSQSLPRFNGLISDQWATVTDFMLSPNHWGDNAVGHKQYLFAIAGCEFEEDIRPFYPEFMHPVFKDTAVSVENIGELLKFSPCKDKVCGLGFSSTRGDSVFVRARSEDNRLITYKVNF